MLRRVVSPERLRAAVAAVHREEFFADLRRGWPGFVFATLLLVAFFYIETSPRHAHTETGVVVGGAVGEFSRGGFPYANVRLRSGALVTVSVPRGLVILNGSRVAVSVIEVDRLPGSAQFMFLRVLSGPVHNQA